MERKKHSGKEGSLFEEDYLINSLKKIIARVNVITDEEITSLLRALSMYDRTGAQNLQTFLSTCQRDMARDIKEIFKPLDAMKLISALPDPLKLQLKETLFSEQRQGEVVNASENDVKLVDVFLEWTRRPDPVNLSTKPWKLDFL